MLQNPTAGHHGVLHHHLHRLGPPQRGAGAGNADHSCAACAAPADNTLHQRSLQFPAAAR